MLIPATGYSAVGSALVWGARGRGFKSRYSDQISPIVSDTLVSETIGLFLLPKILAEQGVSAFSVFR